MERKLSLRRVAALDAGPLARYLAPFLARNASALPNDPYLKTILSSLSDDSGRPPMVRLAAGDLRNALAPAFAGFDAVVARRAVILREALNRYAGIVEQEVSPLDNGAQGKRDTAFQAADRPERFPDSGLRHRPALSVVVWIPHVRSPFNVGNIIRTAAGFGVAGVVLGEAVPEISHPRVRRAAMGATEMVPILRGGRSAAAHLLGEARPEVVALETGGTAIAGFAFPASGIMVVGHEELGTPEDILEECRRAGKVVTVSHDGPKSSLNVSVAAGICLSWWQARGTMD
ncbi:MAG: TrmH family RNA methyltransferase [Alkalispirochaeta sp.]